MTKKDQTLNTYKTSAEQMALRYSNIGARTGDIKETFSHIKKENPKVIELGCGNGRDAGIILKHTDNYLGIDISEKFILMAKEKNPIGKFEVGDIEEFDFPHDTDVIFAFASLIHTPKEVLRVIFKKIYESLSKNGLFRVSLKHKDVYEECTKEDEFGVRTYYLYSLDDIKEIASKFKFITSDTEEKIGQEWIEVLLKK